MVNEHRCPQCHLKLPHLSKLERHFETHMITGDWLCGLCNTVCNRPAALTLHWRNTCTELKTIFCEDELKTISSEDLKEAVFRHTLDVISLESSEEPTTSSTRRESIISRKPEVFSICSYCNLHLPRGSLTHHYGVHTGRYLPGQLIPNSISKFICDLCGFGFRYKSSLIHHWRNKCTELLAHIPIGAVVIDNRSLKEMVGRLVKRSEVVHPVQLTTSEGRKDKEDVGQELEDSFDDETGDSFVGPVNLPDSLRRHLWDLNEDGSLEDCSGCDRKFSSVGRQLHHENSIHSTQKPTLICELCKRSFKQARVLITHLRESCRAMRLEVPDEKRRKTMNREDLLNVVVKAKDRWDELFEKKKVSNIKYMEDFLRECDRKRPQVGSSSNLILPVPSRSFVMGSEQNYHSCNECKITFNTSRFLQQHQQMVHQNERSRNQLIITASSLIPYFKLSKAVFYDLNGKEYRMGKYLDMESDLAKHLQRKVIQTGTRVNLGEENDCFIVELRGGKPTYAVLNEEEFVEVSGGEETLKSLFVENPKTFDDCPRLEREA